jgi:hypothetical protein
MAGVEMERDMNNYDVVHVTTKHPLMSDDELRAIYRDAWELYYSPEHVETVLRRAKTWGYDLRNMMWKLLSFHAPHRLEKVHPLDGGIFRRKYRRDRRPGLPIENALVFHAREGRLLVHKYARFARMYWQYWRTLRRVARDTRSYSDIAMAAPEAAEAAVLALYTATRGAKSEADRLRRRPIPVRVVKSIT